MEFLEGLDQQEVDRKPDRPSPVRVAAKETGPGLRRLVVHTILVSADAEHVRLLFVNARYGSDAERRQELALVQHDAKDSSQLIAVNDRQQAAVAIAVRPHAGNSGGQVRAVFDEPVQPAPESFVPLERLRFEGLDGQQWNQADQGTYLERFPAVVRQMQHVVEQPI